MGLASMVLGIIALFTWLIPPLGLTIAIIGLVLGIIVVVRSLPNKGMAIAGVALSALGALASIAVWIFVGILFFIF